jgi:hypothetical protein
MRILDQYKENVGIAMDSMRVAKLRARSRSWAW